MFVLVIPLRSSPGEVFDARVACRRAEQFSLSEGWFAGADGRNED